MTLQLTTIQQQRRDRKSRPKPCQLDMFAPAAASPVISVQSPRAAAIAAETTMQNEARRTLAAKGAKPANALKPRVQVMKP